MNRRGTLATGIIAVTISLIIIFGINFIATNKTMSTVNDAKEGALKSSVLGYIDAVEKQVMINGINEEKDDDINNGVYTIKELKNKKVTVKGDEPIDGWVKIENNNIVKMSLLLKGGEYVANKDSVYGEVKLEKNGKVKKMPN